MPTGKTLIHIGTNDLGPYAPPNAAWPGGQIWMTDTGVIHISGRKQTRVAKIRPSPRAFVIWLRTRGIHPDKVYRQ